MEPGKESSGSLTATNAHGMLGPNQIKRTDNVVKTKTPMDAALKQSVIRQIKNLHAQGKPLNITAVKRSHPELIAKAFEVEPFWGWKQALEDAGIQYQDIKVELLDHVTCHLCGKQAQTLIGHLKSQHNICGADYRRDYPGAELASEVLRAKSMRGTPRQRKKLSMQCPPHWEPLWSPEYVLDRAAEFRRQGIELRQKNVVAVDQVTEWGREFFGSWTAVLRRIAR